MLRLGCQHASMQAKEINENVRTIIKYNYKYRNGVATYSSYNFGE